MKMFRSGVLGGLLLAAGGASAGSNAEFTGRWEVTSTYPGGSFVAGLDVSAHEGTYEGKSGYLVPDCCWYHYSGSLEKDGLHLKILSPDGKSEFGSLVLTVNKDVLSGKGILHGVPITAAGRRPLERPSGAPRIHNFAPQIFYRNFSGANPPALRIFPGDTVRTQTVDADGGGATAAQRTLPGNPQTGPFYIEGAMIGDTIAVHFSRIR